MRGEGKGKPTSKFLWWCYSNICGRLIRHLSSAKQPWVPHHPRLKRIPLLLILSRIRLLVLQLQQRVTAVSIHRFQRLLILSRILLLVVRLRVMVKVKEVLLNLTLLRQWLMSPTVKDRSVCLNQMMLCRLRRWSTTMVKWSSTLFHNHKNHLHATTPTTNFSPLLPPSHALTVESIPHTTLHPKCSCRNRKIVLKVVLWNQTPGTRKLTIAY